MWVKFCNYGKSLNTFASNAKVFLLTYPYDCSLKSCMLCTDKIAQKKEKPYVQFVLFLHTYIVTGIIIVNNTSES